MRQVECLSNPPIPILPRKTMSKKTNMQKRFESLKGDAFLAMAPRLSPIGPTGSNLVFSPLSLRSMLSLIAAGAGDPAAEQLLSFLKLESIDDVNILSSRIVSAVLNDTRHAGGPKVGFANAVWIHKGLSPKHSFKEVVDHVHKADLRQVDFNTKAHEIVSEVNSWARDKTDGLIPEILDPGSVGRSCRSILTNALYFKGKWSEEYFHESSTEDYDFYLLGGDSVKVPFMKSDYKSRHSIHAYDDFKVLGLPYKKGRINRTQFAMYILLPDAVDGLASLAERVVSEPDFLDHHLSIKHSVKVRTLRIPKFKISSGFSASNTIKQMGVTLAFEAGGVARMVEEDGDELFVSEIYQKVFIEVNEEGTTAAAVTSATGIGSCRIMQRPVVDFVADHPFIFLIREEVSGVVLFFGHVLNPLNDGNLDI